MTQEHPITPPPELVHKWMYVNGEQIAPLYMVQLLATQAARWGADQELDACCEWVGAISGKYGPRLRLSRRPKAPSLKEQALALLDDASDRLDAVHENIIRRALEQLDG